MKTYKGEDYNWNGFWGNLYDEIGSVWDAYRRFLQARNRQEQDQWYNIWNRLLNQHGGPNPQLGGRDIPRINGRKRGKRQQTIQPNKRKARENNRGEVTAEPQTTNPPMATKPPEISIPSTIKCLDLPTRRIQGQKGFRIDNDIIGQWKSYKFKAAREVTTTANTVGYRQLGTRFRNDNTSPIPTLGNGWYASFNGVDKLLRIDGTAAYDTINVTKPVYQTGDATNRNLVTESNDMNACVVLRNQNIRVHMKNASVTETASVTIYLYELKKDMHEIQVDVNGAYVAETHIAAGWTKFFDQSDSNNPPTSNTQDQQSMFFMRENPIFDEYFKVAFVKSFCFQPGQIITQTFSLPKMQVLSYKFMGKSTWCYDTAAEEDRYLHVAHKKGEKIFVVKQHGMMDYNAGAPQYSASTVQYWTESEWEAAPMQLKTNVMTVDRSG